MKKNTVIAIAIIAIALVAIVAEFNKPSAAERQEAASIMLALDYEAQYTTALANDASLPELCSRAMLVKEAYLQADFESGYQLWSTKVKDVCPW